MTDADPTGTPQEPLADRPPGMPRWVKVSGVVILLLVAVLVVSKLAGVEHGPGRHSWSDASPGQMQPAGTKRSVGSPPGVTNGSQK